MSTTLKATKLAWIYAEGDDLGPWIVLCDGCIHADEHLYDSFEDIDWMSDEEASDMRCSCCGATTAEVA